MPYKISEKRRAEYREMSKRSKERKAKALSGNGIKVIHKPNNPKFDPDSLLKPLRKNGLRCLSLFSGGGGFDLGFERAGFSHVACYELLEICGQTLSKNLKEAKIYSGKNGDVRSVNWKSYKGKVDIIHGGPPCQPFSIAGDQRGHLDERDMWPFFIQAVLEIEPKCFIAENVPGLLDAKFGQYVKEVIEKPLHNKYHLKKFILKAEDFGVPQTRSRIFFVGFKNKKDSERFEIPEPTHVKNGALNLYGAVVMGAREALGLRDIGFDCSAPTIRSGFTGPRNTTGVINSSASFKVWEKLQIWPNGVQKTRDLSSRFPPENKHFRLSIQDCALLQGCPEKWCFDGAVYQVLGQIGNSVCPPVSYNLAKSIARVFISSDGRSR
jgi:DNA (cytosine-5)-methyltransferase 1